MSIKKKTKEILEKIEEESSRLPRPERQGPKTNIEKMPEGYSEIGFDIDMNDKRPFVYGVKKIGKDTFLHGASKDKKDYIVNIEKGNLKGSYEKSFQGQDRVGASYNKNGFQAGVSKAGKDKQFTLRFEKKFKKGGMIIGKQKDYIKDLL